MASDTALQAIQKIIKKYGEEAVYRLGEDKIAFINVIPTGSLVLDIALGVGGFPRGRISEVYGTEMSGKTTLCLHTVGNCQRLGGRVAYIDTENALDLDWARKCGVDVASLYVSQPPTSEQALDIAEILLSDFDLVIIDSVAAMLPGAELEGEISDSHMAVQARLMGRAMRRLLNPVKMANACIIFTNQLRSTMAMFGPPEETTGGKALRYAASVRLEVKRKEMIKEKEEVVGNIVRVRVSKNRVAPPFKVADFEIYYDEGISLTSELITYAREVGIIEGGGAGWFTVNDKGEKKKVQGMPALRALFKEDVVLRTNTENSIRQSYGLPLKG